ncbi:MAG: hypothetical protein ACLQGP_10575 [Isosphaeraceae bacterium]
MEQLVNPEDITRLVVFDSWTRNCDRYAPEGRRVNRNNVYLSESAPPDNLLLVAMDHSHCFTCGRPLTVKLAHIDSVQDEGIYGLFPQFHPWLDGRVVRQTIDKLRSFTKKDAETVTRDIPREWEMDVATTDALNQFLVSGAAYLAATIMIKLCPSDEPNSLTSEAESIP